MGSLETTEAECAANAVAPRVTLASMEAKIKHKYVFTADSVMNGDDCPPELRILTVCILVLENGFTLIGKSAPASPDNFNKELGAKLAYEDCIRQLWPLEGYALREKLAGV